MIDLRLCGRKAAPVAKAAIVAAAIACGSAAGYAQGTGPGVLPGFTPPADDADAKTKAAALAAKANIDVGEAWTRATAANAAAVSVYFKVSSVGKQPDRLVGAETSNAKAELTDAAPKNGVLPAVDIPAGGMVTFAPNGRRVTLTGLQAPLKEGESFLMTLIFDKGGRQTAVVKVLGAQATGLPVASPTASRDTTSDVTH